MSYVARLTAVSAVGVILLGGDIGLVEAVELILISPAVSVVRVNMQPVREAAVHYDLNTVVTGLRSIGNYIAVVYIRIDLEEVRWHAGRDAGGFEGGRGREAGGGGRSEEHTSELQS